MRKFLKNSLAIVLSFVLLFSSALVLPSHAISNKTDSDYTAQTNTYIYYSKYGNIYRVNKETKAKKLIYKSKSAWNFTDLSVHNGYIYCTLDSWLGTDFETPNIFRVKTDGTNAKILDKGENPSIYKDKIYYYKLSYKVNKLSSSYPKITASGLYKMNLNGDNKTCLTNKTDNIFDPTLKVCDSYVYYVNKKGTYRIGIDGENNEKLLNKAVDIFYIDGNNIYYNLEDNNSDKCNVFIYNLENNTSKLLKSDIKGFDIKDNYLYYIGKFYASTGKTISKMDLSSNKVTTLISKKMIGWISISDNNLVYKFYTNNSVDNTFYYIMNIDGKENTKLDKTFTP